MGYIYRQKNRKRIAEERKKKGVCIKCGKTKIYKTKNENHKRVVCKKCSKYNSDMISKNKPKWKKQLNPTPFIYY